MAAIHLAKGAVRGSKKKVLQMPDTSTTTAPDIIVVGGRKPKPEPEFDKGDWGYGGIEPIQFLAVNWLEGYGGEAEAQRLTTFQQNGNQVFRFRDFRFEMRFRLEEWNGLTPEQQRAFIHALENYSKSETLTAALQHLHDQGVDVIDLRRGPQGFHPNGDAYDFPIARDGLPAAAGISYYPDPADQSKTTITHPTVVISFNSNHRDAGNADAFAKQLIHELLHPYVPNIGGTDHDRVPAMTDEAWSLIAPGGAAGIDASSIGGVSYLGSYSGDTATGTANNDTLAGMAGNDVIRGGGGNDILAGGVGMDTLVAGTGYSYLYGGLDADTYVAETTAASFIVGDTGGVDRIKIAAASNDVQVQRWGDSLTIWSATDGSIYEITDHYVDGRKIEIFEFTDGEFAASYMEYLASEGGGGGVCYDDGNPVLCGPYGMPVIIDLAGNGVRFSTLRTTRAEMDVNGDGLLDRVGWTIGNDDAFLVFDRNGNGIVDGFAELTYLHDFRGAGSDLEGMLAHDENGDGAITASDSIFAKLMLWTDVNGDGISQSRELKSVEQGGIVSIGLEISKSSKLDQGLLENQILGQSEVRMSDGGTRAAYDVALFFESGRDSCGCHGSSSFGTSSGPDHILVPEVTL